MLIDMTPDGEHLTITIPARFRRRGARRLIIAPEVSVTNGEVVMEDEPNTDKRLVKAVVRAFQWQGWIDSGKYTDTHELAAKINMERSYVSRVVRLTLLAPDIVESILEGTQPRELTLQKIIKRFPHSWEEQREKYGFINLKEGKIKNDFK